MIAQWFARGIWRCPLLIKRGGLFVSLVLTGLVLNSCNPFAPGVDNTLIDRNRLLGDRRTVDGLFEYFKNTYEMRDSLLYGKMIAPEFRFTFFDFSNNNQVFWGRDQEMMATYSLFRSVRQVSLVWNNYVALDTAGSDTLAAVERFFNLTVVQDDARVLRSTGRARLTLRRNQRGTEWMIKDWYDNSDF